MQAIAPFDRITVELGKCGGKPCIRALRITARRVLELLSTYQDRGAVLSEYRFLESEILNQAPRFAVAAVDDQSLGTDCVARSHSCRTRDSHPTQQKSCGNAVLTRSMSLRSGSTVPMI